MVANYLLNGMILQVPPQCLHPPENKALIRGLLRDINNPLIRPYFLGGYPQIPMI